jgi:hypothetical protein
LALAAAMPVIDRFLTMAAAAINVVKLMVQPADNILQLTQTQTIINQLLRSTRFFTEINFI